MLSVPTTAELDATIRGALGDALGVVPRSVLVVLARALAGASALLYRYAGWLAVQWHPAHASNREVTINGRTFVPLALLGRLKGLDAQRAAVPARLTADVDVIVQSGSLPAGTQLRGPQGVIYIMTAAVQLDAASVEIEVEAAGDASDGDGAGEAGNLEVGDELEWVDPLATVAAVATVSAVTQEGADGETEAAFRARVEAAYSGRRRGSGGVDWRAWASDVSHVTGVYPYRGDVPGTVEVYVRVDNQPHGVPTEDQLDEVAAAINFTSAAGVWTADRRQTNALPLVLPIESVAVDVTVNALSGVADAAAVQSQLEAALEEYLEAREPWVEGVTLPPRSDSVSASGVQGVVQGIVGAANGTTGAVIVEIDEETIDVHQLTKGQCARLGSISFL